IHVWCSVIPTAKSINKTEPWTKPANMNINCLPLIFPFSMLMSFPLSTWLCRASQQVGGYYPRIDVNVQFYSRVYVFPVIFHAFPLFFVFFMQHLAKSKNIRFIRPGPVKGCHYLLP